ncbi:orotidine-5'-phosphate decarboxylase [Psittacicella melopsittaci]|uniref:Orotidine 5'-phosphate decarboxylase n=1 Tax=Psittacicella melopsittaci TaxID=2028576 RepID=A0A3A1Y1V1_9GAMM|nr:orotidine-5'-phosphate decarboxylase [Psittacicella melopsittaci]RIY32213.1 orotidine-5'-phosphate decarboxylase [Psittacicella melopsittaci]
MRQVIIALDFPTLDKTLQFLSQFEQKLFVKIGMELYLQNGPEIIQRVKALGHQIFLDLKLHDIPNTVYGACKGLAQFKVDLLTVHAAGGEKMLAAAKQGMLDGGSPETKIIAITQLTSTSQEQMQEEQGITGTLEQSVERYALLAKNAQLDGVVCSVHEAQRIHQLCGEDFLTVTPGIRREGDQTGDQQRVATPSLAKALGSNYIVVGRPISQSENPEQAYQDFVKNFN